MLAGSRSHPRSGAAPAPGSLGGPHRTRRRGRRRSGRRGRRSACPSRQRAGAAGYRSRPGGRSGRSPRPGSRGRSRRPSRSPCSEIHLGALGRAPVVRGAHQQDARTVALGKLVGEVCPALGIPAVAARLRGVALGIPGARRDGDEQAPVRRARSRAVPARPVAGPRDRARTPGCGVAGGRPRPRRGAARSRPGSPPRLGLTRPVSSSPIPPPTPLRCGMPAKYAAVAGADARRAEEDGVEPEPAKRRPEAEPSGSLAPQPCKRDDLVDRRDAVGNVRRRRRTDERDASRWIARSQRPQQRRRLQSFGHPAVHDHRDIHASTV